MQSILWRDEWVVDGHNLDVGIRARSSHYKAADPAEAVDTYGEHHRVLGVLADSTKKVDR